MPVASLLPDLSKIISARLLQLPVAYFFLTVLFVSQMTNLNWRVDSSSIQTRYKVRRVRVLNDFAAVGYGITAVAASDLVALNNVRPEYVAA